MLVLCLLIGLIGAQECQAPPNLADITYLCADGICVSICENDLLVPSDGPNQFNCGDYPSGDYPFATVCGQPCPQPPPPTDNLQQDCTNTRCAYSCDNGHFLTGPVEVICNLNGQWGSAPPVCSAKKQYCPPIQAPLLADCTDNIEFTSICDFSCKSGYELMGSQNAECIYQAGSYQWSVPLPTCKSADVPDPITVPTEQSPTDSPDDPNDKDITTEDPQPEDCSDGRFSLACWREPRNQIIIGCIGGGILILILIVVIIFCCIKKRNDSEKEGPAFFDENPTLQKSVRSSHADNDHIVAPNSYASAATMGHSVPSNSFYRGQGSQRTQYAHRHVVSSPKPNVYGPYSEVQINPNRNQDEEGLPFINDPSNIDNFNDSAHYAGSSRGGLAQNAHYDYGQLRQQPQMSTFFS